MQSVVRMSADQNNASTASCTRHRSSVASHLLIFSSRSATGAMTADARWRHLGAYVTDRRMDGQTSLLLDVARVWLAASEAIQLHAGVFL